MGPSISVAMCSYQHASFLRRSLEAICAQSRPPDQVVIVDDASTDETPEVLAEFKDRFPFVEPLRNEVNRGVVDSFNRAIGAARGDYLYIAAADDLLLPGAFESLSRAFLSCPQVPVLFGQMAVLDSEGRTLGVVGPSAWTRPCEIDPREYLHEFFLRESPQFSLCAAVLWRREALSGVGGYRHELGPFCDTFAMHSLALREGACYLPRPIAAWRSAAAGFAQSLAADPLKALANVEQVVAAMRAEAVFPSFAVEQWRGAYRAEIVSAARLRRQRALEALGQSANSTSSFAALRALEHASARLDEACAARLLGDAQ